MRAHLEGSGIAAFVRDDHTVAADWALSNAIGGVKVEVADEDFEAAIALLGPSEQEMAQRVASVKRSGGKLQRYATVFGSLFVLIFALLFWRKGSAYIEVTLLISLFLSGCIALFCSLFDSRA